MIIAFYIFFSLLAAYILLLFWFSIGFIKTKKFISNTDTQLNAVSIIICARNEEKTIARCLKTIIEQNYERNKIQIILINDASTDSTVLQAEIILKNSGLNFKIISNKEQKGKKHSISYAMQFVSHELIILRDADTFTKSDLWLKTISNFYSTKKPDLIIGPVTISDNSGLLWSIQFIENSILTVINAGSAFFKKPILCNGANLIFTKSIFEKVNGYLNHINIKSGDDILFLEDLKKKSGAKIEFLKSKEAIVSTYPCISFADLLKQKIRWASKVKVNPSLLNLSLAVLSFIINLIWLFCLIYGYLVPQNAKLSLFFMLLKLFIDFLLLFLASRFIKNQTIGWYILPIGLVYPIYSCIIAIASLFIKPKWKQ